MLYLAVQVQLDSVVVLSRCHDAEVPDFEQLLEILLVDELDVFKYPGDRGPESDIKLPDLELLPFILELLSIDLELVVEILRLQRAVNRVERDRVLDVSRSFPSSRRPFKTVLLLPIRLQVFPGLKVELLVHIVEKLVLFDQPFVLLSLVDYFQSVYLQFRCLHLD